MSRLANKVNVGIETGSWINIVAGVVVAAVGYYQTYYQTSTLDNAFWSATIGGLLLVVIGAFTAWMAATSRDRSTLWPSGLALLTGVWLAAYPWFISVSDAYFYTSVAAGVVVALTSAYEMYAAFRSDETTMRRPTA